MKQFIAFTKKEFIEFTRSGRLFLLMTLSTLFGIMNPAIAKLLPWLADTMSQSLADTGLIITEIKVDAMSSWTQFYKNIPIALILFLLMISGILTIEYQKGTLINIITKGMDRWKIIISKLTAAFSLWTAGYWICYGVTYVYNACFWDNRIVSHLFFSAFCFYLIGIWMLSLILFFSVLFQNNSAVLTAAGCSFLLVYLIGFTPKIKKFLPVRLLDSVDLLSGIREISEYLYAVMILILLVIGNILAAVWCFNKKNI